MCGAADRPLAALDGRTPIEAAPTPCLDGLARRGSQCPRNGPGYR